MKICSSCKQEKPLSDYNYRGTKIRLKCKQCLYRYQKQRWNRYKAKLVLAHGGHCVDCGRNGHPAIFDFHHRDPTQKDFEISRKRCLAYHKILAESMKCDLLCSCCHRLRHINQDVWKFDFNDPNFNNINNLGVKYMCSCGEEITYKATNCVKCSKKKTEFDLLKSHTNIHITPC